MSRGVAVPEPPRTQRQGTWRGEGDKGRETITVCPGGGRQGEGDKGRDKGRETRGGRPAGRQLGAGLRHITLIKGHVGGLPLVTDVEVFVASLEVTIERIAGAEQAVLDGERAHPGV